jgi:excinuclease ABC subunit B
MLPIRPGCQLYSEFKQFFSENAVEYFISFYDSYQPEAYVPSTDMIRKDSSINDEIDKLSIQHRGPVGTPGCIIVAMFPHIWLRGPKDYYSWQFPCVRNGVGPG